MTATTPTISNAPRVALAGFYGAGNFGDDLSAVLFGLALRRLGIPFSVYGLCEPYAQRFGFERAATPAALLDGAGAFVWGGGGLLVSWRNLTYRLLYPSAAPTLDRLVQAAIGREIPVLLASIGGDGRSVRVLTPPYKARLLASADVVTVRNPQDVAAVEAQGKTAAYFPDIVWGLSRVVPVERRPHERLRIGLDLYPSNLLRQGALHVLPRLQSAVRERTDCDFVCIDTTNASRKSYRGLGGFIRGGNVSRYQFRHLDEDLALVASLDVVFSSRFHVPIVAMQYGVPSVSVFAEPKTRLLYANLGLDQHAYHVDRSAALFSLLRSRADLDGLIRGFAFPDTAKLGADSLGHIDALRDALSPQAGPLRVGRAGERDS